MNDSTTQTAIPPPTALPFTCNLCGNANAHYTRNELEREGGLCPTCGASVRARALVHLTSMALFRRSLPAPVWPPVAKTVYGISDWPGFEQRFRAAFDYTNTQFDTQEFPDSTYLDICRPHEAFVGTADAVTCSDVLEHVAPPVQLAFNGLYSLLKPGGSLIFSVPYSLDETVEHFPDLCDWRIDTVEGRRILRNRTVKGELQEFDDLCFHGGGASVLEMRVFGLKSLIEHLVAAGFESIEVFATDVLAYGIRLEPWSRPIIAKRPL